MIVKTDCETDGSFYSTSLNRDSGLMGVAMDDFTLAILIWASCCCSQGLTNRNIVSAVSNFECFQSCCSARSRCCCWWSFLSTSRCWPLPPSSLHSNISNISTGKTQEQKYIPQQKHALEVSLVLQNEMVFIVALFLVSLQSRKAIACNRKIFTPIILGMDLVSGHHHPLSPYRQQAWRLLLPEGQHPKQEAVGRPWGTVEEPLALLPEPTVAAKRQKNFGKMRYYCFKHGPKLFSFLGTIHWRKRLSRRIAWRSPALIMIEKLPCSFVHYIQDLLL